MSNVTKTTRRDFIMRSILAAGTASIIMNPLGIGAVAHATEKLAALGDFIGTSPIGKQDPDAEATTGPLSRMYVEHSLIKNAGGPIFLAGCNVRGRAWNPARDGKYDDWYTDRYQDSERISSWGMNIIRLITYWECIETSTSPTEFEYDSGYIQRIAETVEAYNQHGIYVYIDLHTHEAVNELSKFIPTAKAHDTTFADAFYTDRSAGSARQHLANLWLRLSETFRDNNGVAGYGLCNEPHNDGLLSSQQAADYWFDIADYVTAALRNVGDDHIVFVNFAPEARRTGFMTRKLRDPNVVYESHFYYGINDTHVDGLTVTNNDFNWLREQFDSEVDKKMLEFGVPYIIGEQGFQRRTIQPGDPFDMWLRNVLSIEKTSPLLQGWLYWSYISYNGNLEGSGWQSTLVNMSKKILLVNRRH